ncbi:uncharacterized protein LOC132704831 [Cylas formicarius]|uniref:uncharacterized protein LOC132704831 n=1 Tax=Cylas formicarius TaxID=197179 RepID=UPI0029586200|nr:uncharacterized protein LOC132704831 [Cylas formicarius]
MEVANKLDEDFLFYLGFTNTFLRRLAGDVFHKSKLWLYKLCTEPCETIEKKRNRNMYLANLLINMQNSKLEEPFTQSPTHVDISNAMEIFGPIPHTIEPPAWLNDTEYSLEGERRGEEKKGRTYFATRTLPNGQGAFAYIGISAGGADWTTQVGAGDVSLERRGALERRLEQKFEELVPAQYEMEKILAKRHDPREREKVLTFYDVLLQNVADELDGKGPLENETVEGLLDQLIDDLKNKGQYEEYNALDDYDKRMELLQILYSRIKTRRDKVAKREEYLDDIEEKVMPKSFFETSTEPEDEYLLPSAMWQQAINKLPTKKQIERLMQAYPVPVIEKLIQYLSQFKEEIAERVHKRHENIATQMKKELRKEGIRKKKEAERAELAYHDTTEIHNEVKERYKKKTDAEEANRELDEPQLTDHSRLYEEMKAVVLDTQKLVEQEAAKGKFLASQINAVSLQSEEFHMVNNDIITQTEKANMKILSNIKRLNAAIKQHENMLADFRAMAQQTKKNTDSTMMMLF